MGVRSFRASSGAEAAQVLRSTPIHAAVVDLRLPLDRCAAATRTETTPASPSEEGGERLLEILRRLEAPPPTVVVTRDRTPRERMRELHHALRHGAYAVVLGSAADAEQMLRVLQRLVTRYYQNRWPGATLPQIPPTGGSGGGGAEQQ
jgi:CheY-like chemotaxis protein